MNTPTPRTDDIAGSLIDAEEVVPADFARELERDLATEQARLDWLLLDVVSRFDDAYYTRATIDAKMKEDVK